MGKQATKEIRFFGVQKKTTEMLDPRYGIHYKDISRFFKESHTFQSSKESW